MAVLIGNDNFLGIGSKGDVGVMGNNNNLASLLTILDESPQLGVDGLVVEVVFGLVNEDGAVALLELDDKL